MWGDEELVRADQYTYLGVEFKKDSSWNVHMNKVEKGKVRARNYIQ